MTTRRAFLAGAAASLAPTASWADAGSPAYLSAAMTPGGAYRLYGIGEDLNLVFSVSLPGRGHAAAAHPNRPEAVVFARRPGVFALVIDCRQGRPLAKLEAPSERHFYGHGAFSRDGARLYTTENAFEDGRGVIGVWAADDGYRRIGEFPSGGVGPHDIVRQPDADALVVANGGIDTHPDTGREKLNLPTMRSNISFLDEDGRIQALWETSEPLRLNSMRHLAARGDGLIAFGCQWQGDPADAPSLVGVCSRERSPRLLANDFGGGRTLNGYVGSVSFTGDGSQICATAPRGDGLAWFDVYTGTALALSPGRDICGAAAAADGVLASDGGGGLTRFDGKPLRIRHPLSWDNHLISVEGGLS